MSDFATSQLLPLDNSDQAPDCRGIYVWYSRPSLGLADWDEHHTETAQTNILRAINKFTKKHQNQPLNIHATANFSIKWDGDVYTKNDDENLVDDALSSHDETNNHFVTATKHNDSRSKLIQLMESSFPTFHSPLYIGRATEQTLHERIEQHRNSFYRHWQQSTKDPTYKDRLINNTKNFASRAVVRGFSPSDLYFQTIHPSPSATMTSSEESDLIKSIEWLLNRWAFPLLGRQ